jgi:F-type H+-transporting ATPase subunit epsilon
MSSAKLEIITPDSMFYSGDVDILMADTVGGEEGYMPRHVWCCKLLKENGKVKLREAGAPAGPEGLKTAVIKGGYVEIRDHFVVYTEGAEWEE